MRENFEIKKIAFIGDYLPRKCGIATFTNDLCKSVSRAYPKTKCLVVPVNDTPDGYVYPREVRFEILEQDLSAYLRAADFLNITDVDLVCVQHEFGIYGGDEGSHILAMMHTLQIPIVTTLHTILEKPNPIQLKVMGEIIRLSTRLIVMSEKGKGLLIKHYQAPESKISMIPHGIPDIPFADPNYFKEEFGVAGKQVILTFGLLSPNKGIEFALEAMPEILKDFPETVFIVVGQTHPHLLKQVGEQYRVSLELLANTLNIQKNVVFFNRFVELDELTRFIGAADIYLTPYLTETQITSGTLAYAYGTGNAVVSTPYWHAKELLDQERGRLVPFRDSGAIAGAVIELFRDSSLRHKIRKEAYTRGRGMIWSVVARMYMDAFREAGLSHGSNREKSPLIATLDTSPDLLPVLKLDHLYLMSDSTGIFQHASFGVPNFAEGYCTDDNARAFILTLLLQRSGRSTERSNQLAAVYAAFMSYAYNHKTGRFRNFMSFNRDWINEPGSEDCHGQAIWALGMSLGHHRHKRYQPLAASLFEAALPVVADFKSPRAWAFALLGIDEYLKQFNGDRRTEQMREHLVMKLIQRFHDASATDWVWFEDKVTYANAKLSHALILSGRVMKNNEALEIGLKTLSWLLSIQTSSQGIFQAIGTNGFYEKGKKKASFDQQPIEVQATISACIEAFNSTGEMSWAQEARRIFDWFQGRNDLGLGMYDPESGGCRDGLHSDRVSQNQGAESSLAFLLSLEEMYILQGKLASFKTDSKRKSIK
ncbi:glycosyltransferase family 4 protein [Spirochaeta cellobiosiphila]|uniref:glycosyltransferase family 4 protein n=1 Tax=Spirochaeta cellobiosiphila TaxID=504483 RepID=UPI0003FF2B24|nr:glycosyltransferase family 4 protein [Spirochaeta cellobiosiphila]